MGIIVTDKTAPTICGVPLVRCTSSAAISATCEECGALFDNNVTYFSIRQKVGLHKRAVGHKRFAYWTAPPKKLKSVGRKRELDDE